jgi:hypothetical protein
MVRTGEELGKIERWHYSTLAGSALHKGDTKWRCAIQTLVSLYIRNGRCARFHDKKDASAFMMGDGIGDAHTFVTKGDAPRETRVSFTCIIRDV